MADVTISVTMTREEEWQLAQFCKRSCFEQAFNLTEAGLSKDERTERAYSMFCGIDALRAALRDAGIDPR